MPDEAVEPDYEFLLEQRAAADEGWATRDANVWGLPVEVLSSVPPGQVLLINRDMWEQIKGAGYKAPSCCDHCRAADAEAEVERLLAERDDLALQRDRYMAEVERLQGIEARVADLRDQWQEYADGDAGGAAWIYMNAAAQLLRDALGGSDE